MLDLSPSLMNKSSAYALNAHALLDALPDDFTYTRADAAATRIDENGDIQALTTNETPIDHNTDGSTRGIRIEDTRTNLADWSNNATGWTTVGGAVVTDTGTDVGALNKVSIASNGQNWHRAYTGAENLTSGSIYSATAYILAGTSGRVRITIRDEDAATETFLFGTIGALSSSSALSGTITNLTEDDFGDYIKITFNFTPNSNNSYTFAIGPDTATTGETVFALGLQFELGANPSSFIITGAGSATRAAPLLRMATPPTISAKSGGIILEYEDQSPRSAPNIQTLFQYGASDTDDRIAVFKNTNGDLLFRVTSGGTEYMNHTFDSDGIVAGINKIGITWQENQCYIAVNGIEVLKLTVATIPTDISYGLTLGMFAGGSLPFDGWIRDVKFISRYNGRAILENLTDNTVAVTGGTFDAARNMVICAGQSNMTPKGTDADPTLANTVYLLANDGALKTYAEPFDDVTNAQFGTTILYDAAVGDNGSPGTIIDDLCDEYGGEWVAVPASKGGMGITYAADPTEGCYIDADIGNNKFAIGMNAYGIFMRIKQARALGTIRLIVWQQGATDALNGISNAAFIAATTAFLDRCRSYAGGNPPVLRVALQDKPQAAWLESTYPSNTWDDIRATDLTYPYPNSAIIDSEGHELQSDELHFTTAGFTTLGAAIAAGAITLIDGQ